MQKLYKTNNTDLAAFLLLEGIELSHLEKEANSVNIFFKDTKSNCSDLERVFIFSREKKYRELHKILLKQVHAKLKEE